MNWKNKNKLLKSFTLIFIAIAFLSSSTTLISSTKINHLKKIEMTFSENNSNEIKITGNSFITKINKVGKTDSKAIELVQLEIENCVNTGIYGSFNLPVHTKLVSLPENGNYIVKNRQFDFDEFDLDDNTRIAPVGFEENLKISDKSVYKEDSWFPENIITISKPNIMRGLRFSQISLATVQYNAYKNKYRVIKNVNIEFEIDNSINENPLNTKGKSFQNRRSNSFFKLAKSNILGVRNDNYLGGLTASDKGDRKEYAGNYLIVIPDALENDIKFLVNWKNKLGFKTTVAKLSETGSTNENIKSYIQNAYDNWEYPPDYVLLVGDVDGSIVVPSFYKVATYPSNGQNVTDLPYSLLEGNDYFPDLYIGRLSIRDITTLYTISNKIIKYESNSDSPNNDWMKKALMIGFFDPDGFLSGTSYTSAYETLMTVKDKLLDNGFDGVKSLIESVDNFITPEQINNEINSGYSIINYRGFGMPYTWSAPYYGNYNIIDLNNGYFLPFITSIVCGGGAFHSTDVPECFGETWLNAGSATNPKGAIGFIGPSERDTKTWFNNPIDLGIFQGIAYEDIKSGGEILLRGKMEVYNNYPDGHEWGNSYVSDQFYFYVYNLLGDPSLRVWVDSPKELEFVFDAEIEEGTSNFIEIQVSTNEIEKSNFIVAITENISGNLISVDLTDEFGIARVECELNQGEYSITVSKREYKPKTEILNVISGDNLIISDINLSGEANPGENLSLTIKIRNPYTETANCSYSFTTESDYITLPAKDKTDITIEANDSLTIELNDIQISEKWNDDLIVDMFLNLSSNFSNQINIIQLELYSPEFTIENFIVDNSSGALEQGEENNLSIELLNSGRFNSETFSAILECTNDNGEIIQNTSNYSNINQNDIGTNQTSFSIVIPEDIITGQAVNLKIKIQKESEELQILDFSFPVGLVNISAPTIDSYGYVAIENSDDSIYELPIYNWTELDTDLSGIGTLFNTPTGYPDGKIGTLNLPFQMTFYGEVYDKISISTEGYITLGESERIYHRNKSIPSGNGPAGMIAPFWDDLDNGEIYTFYNESLGELIIEWSEYRCFGIYSSNQSFQVILYDTNIHPTETGDNKILFQYKNFENVDWDDNYATVGIENQTQTEGLLISYANRFPITVHEITNETAILFTNIVLNQTGIEDNYELAIMNYELKQNYPNPFNPITKINYTSAPLSVNQSAEIVVYNSAGQQVWSSPITHQVSRVTDSILFDGSKFNSGIYYYSLVIDGKKMDTKSMVLIK